MPPVLRRLTRALVALWFAVLTAEPKQLHACPMHDGPTAAAAGGQVGHAGHTGHGASKESKSDTHQCSCLGTCAVSLGAPEPAVAWVEPCVNVVQTVGLPAHDRLVVAAPFAIPFGNGPPRS